MSQSTPTALSAEEMSCETCQGNGEVVADWDRCLGPPQEGDEGDEGTAICLDCDGRGRRASAPPTDTSASGAEGLKPCPFCDQAPALSYQGGDGGAAIVRAPIPALTDREEVERLREAWLDGFAQSGEGWNAEYPFNWLKGNAPPEAQELCAKRLTALQSAGAE